MLVAAAPAGNMVGMPEVRLTGRLLAASPALHDPNFDRTVVLVLDHGDGGALGLVLNRPSETVVDDPLPQWRARATEPPVVFVGGPVSRSSAICLARSPREVGANGWQPLFGRLGTLDLGLDPDDVSVTIDGLRIFAGYAGWGTGQLEAEIAAGAWFVLRAEPEDAFAPDPNGLWRRVLHRQRGVLAALANYPPDLAVN